MEPKLRASLYFWSVYSYILGMFWSEGLATCCIMNKSHKRCVPTTTKHTHTQTHTHTHIHSWRLQGRSIKATRSLLFDNHSDPQNSLLYLLLCWVFVLCWVWVWSVIMFSVNAEFECGVWDFIKLWVCMCVASSEKIERTVQIEASTVEIEERGVKLRLTVVDTPGYGDAINSQDWWGEVCVCVCVYEWYAAATWQMLLPMLRGQAGGWYVCSVWTCKKCIPWEGQQGVVCVCEFVVCL